MRASTGTGQDPIKFAAWQLVSQTVVGELAGSGERLPLLSRRERLRWATVFGIRLARRFWSGAPAAQLELYPDFDRARPPSCVAAEVPLGPGHNPHPPIKTPLHIQIEDEFEVGVISGSRGYMAELRGDDKINPAPDFRTYVGLRGTL